MSDTKPICSLLLRQALDEDSAYGLVSPLQGIGWPVGVEHLAHGVIPGGNTNVHQLMELCKRLTSVFAESVLLAIDLDVPGLVLSSQRERSVNYILSLLLSWRI